jgi:putative tryptophan/tyrosine transport system substrate-binding protein
MKRRDFITLLGVGAAAWPLAGYAQQPERMRRIGVLMNLAEGDPDTKARVAMFRQGLERRGWSEDRNIRVDYRFAAANAERIRAFAKELVGLQPDVILAQSTVAAAELQRETRAIPIVFVQVSDPVGAGFIANMGRPGGNLTGVLHLEAGVIGKWLTMLKEITPRLAHAAVMGNRKTASLDYFVRSAQAVASSFAVEVVASHVETAADIERAIESIARVPDSGLIFPPDSLTVTHRDLIIALAARHRLPAVYATHLFVAAGGLMSYGTDQDAMFRLAAYYVDRILRGDKPAELPVQAPTKFETSVNLKTAKALGLTVPPALLVAADEVVE